MTFHDVVKRYHTEPTDAVLYRVAAALCGEMKMTEKLHMLSGRQFFLRNGFDLITKGQKYNCRPCLTGGKQNDSIKKNGRKISVRFIVLWLVSNQHRRGTSVMFTIR